MSAAERRMPLREAEAFAAELAAEMTSACERVEIAGSVRRRKADVGDIEIVAIPRRARDLFGGAGESLLDARLRRMAADGIVTRLKGGAYFQQFAVAAAGCKLDLFTPCRETWGVVYTQRTGSAAFAHRLVTPRDRWTSDGPGMLAIGLRVHRARLWRGDEHVPTPEETDVFRVAGVPWVRPEDRR